MKARNDIRQKNFRFPRRDHFIMKEILENIQYMIFTILSKLNIKEIRYFYLSQ